MKNKVSWFKISTAVTGIIFISSVIFLYFPYFGLWNESEILEKLDEGEIISRAEQLDEVQLF